MAHAHRQLAERGGFPLEVIAEAGTLIGWDGDEEIRTPYDDCVLIMPSKRLRNQVGASAVRLGRLVS